MQENDQEVFSLVKNGRKKITKLKHILLRLQNKAKGLGSLRWSFLFQGTFY